MSRGDDAMRGAHAKLDWAESRELEMRLTFLDFAQPGSDDRRPLGISFNVRERPAGLVVASFIAERPMPQAMTMLSADVIHNTRVVLDHILARLKESFGGNIRRGYFPIWRSEQQWTKEVVAPGGDGPLHGLERTPAWNLIHDVQPFHHAAPNDDPLVVLSALNNADKHRLLHPAYVYPAGAKTGYDLIEIVDPRRVKPIKYHWRRGDELENGTPIASYAVRGDPRTALRSRCDLDVGCAAGPRDGPSVSYTDMIQSVRAIVDKAAALIDQAPWELEPRGEGAL